MKRKISFLLALTLLLTIIPLNSFAGDYDKQLKEAITRSKKLFNIGNEYDKFEQETSTREGNVVFYLNWGDTKGKLGGINLTIAEDGTIMSLSKWKPEYEGRKPQLPKINKEEGLKIAEEFIKKASPKFADSIKYVDISEPLNINSGSYEYYFRRTENGIPYNNNNLDIYIDNSTGEVMQYYANWDMDLVFPDSKGIISLDKAEELFKEKIGLDLLYKTSYNDRNPKTYLVYGPLNTNLGIDAKSGETVLTQDYYRYYEKSADMGGMGAAPEENLNPDEQKAVDGISGLISKEEAEKIARKILGIDSKYKLRDVNLYSNWSSPNEYRWDMNFVRKLDSEYYYTNIAINAKTKELLSFYKDEPIDPKAELKYNKEKALEIAKKYIKKVSPDKFDLVELDQNFNWGEPVSKENPPRIHNFRFIRKIDNAYVQGDEITVVVDGVSGNIREYRVNWSNKDFPSKDNVIPVDKANEILFKEIGMELKYVSPERYERFPKEKNEALLVYGLKSVKPANIDANTGTILDHSGDPYKILRKVEYKDIDKSYAKDKIKILAQYGIALPGEEFKPSEKITQKDFLYLLARANNPYLEIKDSNVDLYNSSINMGIIKEEEKAPEKVVTKEEGVKYIIRILKYDKIADLTDIYKDIFNDTKDIDPKLKGYVSIAHGLKIVEGNNGKFNPKAELKREDGANMIYNYLFNEN